MKFLPKTKQIAKFRFFNWLACFIAFVGLILISVHLLLSCEQSHPVRQLFLLKAGLVLFTLLFILSFIYEYMESRRAVALLTKLSETIGHVENDLAASVSPELSQQMDIMAVSAVLKHALENLNEKNERLKSEIERNERLSENIAEFYRQMKSLKKADYKFDFFEYEIKSAVFIFISGMITAVDDNEDVTEIPGQELFSSYNFSITHDEFRQYVKDCLSEDAPLSFECTLTDREKNIHWLKFWGSVSKDKMRITGAITDITREVLQRNAEKDRAIHDNITGFYNRNALSEIAGKAIAECAEGEHVFFVYIGLTGYQEFQERFGMVAGNTYIRVCADVFKKFLKDNYVPFRWWGSDFLMLIKGSMSVDEFRENCRWIINKIEKYIGDVDGIAVTFPIAIGYAASGIHGDTPAELIEYAAFAEHEAFREVAMSPNEFNRERFEEARRASLRRTFIKDIIDRNQLSVVFQPIVSLKSGELFGFEALSRPGNPIYRNIVELIQDAEASGHYAILEKRMVYNALDSYMARPEKYKDLYLFINTAPYATLDEKDYNDIRDRYFGHMKVIFEVVERNRMDPEEINLRKSIVTKAGAKFALDDFGSGYSNHLALLALEPDIIKLDRELVRGIDKDIRKQHMLEDIMSYSRYRGTRVLAEGVETQDELETLCRMGIDYAQGYFTGRPNPVLTEPDERAQEVIRSISRSNQLNMRHVFVMIEKSMALVSRELSQSMALTAYLVMKVAKRLGCEGDKLAGLVITAMFCDIGLLYPGLDGNSPDENRNIPPHSLFAYLLLKEFSPYPESARAVLYHHQKCGSTAVKVNHIEIPDEAYLIGLAGDISEIAHAKRGLDLYGHISALSECEKYKPQYVEALKALCDEGIIPQITSGDYLGDLIEYMACLKLGKAEVEGVVRTFVYGITFRSPYRYAHARIMEITVGMLARLTKQNWNLVERVRVAALIYNISILSVNRDELDQINSAEEEHRMVCRGLESVIRILREADLVDIMDLFNGVIGEKVSSERRMLMGKDIVIGSNMLNLADLLAILLEDRATRTALSCQDAVDELMNLAGDSNIYVPMIEMMGDYIEDVEGTISSSRANLTKRYQNILASLEKHEEGYFP